MRKITRIPTKISLQALTELRARAVLEHSSVEEYLDIVLREWEIGKISSEQDATKDEETIAWLPIEVSFLSSIRATAKRHGLSVKQAIAEAINENVAYWREKEPHFSAAAIEHGDNVPLVEPGADVTDRSCAHPGPVTDAAVAAFREEIVEGHDRHHECLRPECEHRWKSRLDRPKICPRCKSPRWNEPSRDGKVHCMAAIPEAMQPEPAAAEHLCEDCETPITGSAPLCEDCTNKMNADF
jgi:hypothetical protein